MKNMITQIALVAPSHLYNFVAFEGLVIGILHSTHKSLLTFSRGSDHGQPRLPETYVALFALYFLAGAQKGGFWE